MGNEFKKVLAAAFKKVQKPLGYFANLYEEELLDGIEVEIQGRDVKATYSVDTQLGTGGRRHEFSQFDSATYTVPEYNDFVDISERDVYKQQFGETIYAKTLANSAKYIADRQAFLSDMQTRAENKQAIEALLNGKVILANGNKIEFRKKASHDLNLTSKKWDAVSSGKSVNDPLAEIEKACQLIIDDGKVGTSEFNLTLSGKTANALLTNTYFVENSKFNNNINRSQIGIPVEKTPGAFFHGQFAAGSYIVNLFTCNEKYEVPTGYNFADEGTTKYYLPEGRGLLLPVNVEFKKYYGSINPINFAPANDIIIPDLTPVKTRQYPYAYRVVTNGSSVVQAGVKSRPLYVPVNIDSAVTFSNLVS